MAKPVLSDTESLQMLESVASALESQNKELVSLNKEASSAVSRMESLVSRLQWEDLRVEPSARPVVRKMAADRRETRRPLPINAQGLTIFQQLIGYRVKRRQTRPTLPTEV